MRICCSENFQEEVRRMKSLKAVKKHKDANIFNSKRPGSDIQQTAHTAVNVDLDGVLVTWY